MAEDVQIAALKAQLQEARAEFWRKQRDTDEAETVVYKLTQELNALGVDTDTDPDEDAL